MDREWTTRDDGLRPVLCGFFLLAALRPSLSAHYTAEQEDILGGIETTLTHTFSWFEGCQPLYVRI